MTAAQAVRVLDGAAVNRLLPVADCITAIENALRSSREARSFVGGVAAESGKFHLKAALSDGPRPLFAAKVNANFPGNRARGAPTIQGVLVVFDARDGSPLAIMDSMSVTAIRTAAASAIAARHLAAADASTLAIAGCGVQAMPHLAAIRAVRPIRRVIAFDIDHDAALDLASRAGDTLDAAVARSIQDFRDADIVVTCTSSRTAFLDPGHVREGACILAVGADSADKSEIDPALYAASFVVVDDLDQCAEIGDLRHALEAGAIGRSHVRGSLSDLVTGAIEPPSSTSGVRLFDSTGVPIEDVAAAAIILQRAELEGAGERVHLNQSASVI